jgi:hypothetical protein
MSERTIAARSYQAPSALELGSDQRAIQGVTFVTAATGSRSGVDAGLGSRSSERAISTHLLGAPIASHAFSGRESNFVKSRIDAARLVLEAVPRTPALRRRMGAVRHLFKPRVVSAGQRRQPS